MSVYRDFKLTRPRSSVSNPQIEFVDGRNGNPKDFSHSRLVIADAFGSINQANTCIATNGF